METRKLSRQGMPALSRIQNQAERQCISKVEVCISIATIYRGAHWLERHQQWRRRKQSGAEGQCLSKTQNNNPTKGPAMHGVKRQILGQCAA